MIPNVFWLLLLASRTLCWMCLPFVWKGYFPDWAKSPSEALQLIAERNSSLLNCAYDTLQVCALGVLAEVVCHWCLTCFQTVCNFGVLVALLPLSLFHFCFCRVLLSEQSTELLTVLGMCWLLNNHKRGHCAKFWFGVTVFSASRPWCSSREIKVFTDALWISTLVASPLEPGPSSGWVLWHISCCEHACAGGSLSIDLSCLCSDCLSVVHWVILKAFWWPLARFRPAAALDTELISSWLFLQGWQGIGASTASSQSTPSSAELQGWQGISKLCLLSNPCDVVL